MRWRAGGGLAQGVQWRESFAAPTNRPQTPARKDTESGAGPSAGRRLGAGNATATPRVWFVCLLALYMPPHPSALLLLPPARSLSRPPLQTCEGRAGMIPFLRVITHWPFRAGRRQHGGVENSGRRPRMWSWAAVSCLLCQAIESACPGGIVKLIHGGCFDFFFWHKQPFKKVCGAAGLL